MLAKARLHPETQRMLDEPNAGGHSEQSEALSFEILQAFLDARDLRTEMEVQYNLAHTSIVDFVCTLCGFTVGVSVTRAMKYKPGPEAFDEADATRLLRKKLAGLQRAAEHVARRDKFSDNYFTFGHNLNELRILLKIDSKKSCFNAQVGLQWRRDFTQSFVGQLF